MAKRKSETIEVVKQKRFVVPKKVELRQEQGWSVTSKKLGELIEMEK